MDYLEIILRNNCIMQRLYYGLKDFKRYINRNSFPMKKNFSNMDIAPHAGMFDLFTLLKLGKIRTNPNKTAFVSLFS